MSDIEYSIVKSKRKSISIQITPDGKVIVRAPLRANPEYINQIVSEKEGWIRKKLIEIESTKNENLVKYTMDELEEIADKAVQIIPERVKYYAPLIGVTYGRITIRKQKTRWGSCSSKGNLNFNCLLVLMPLEVLDSVVVHELCHRKEMNHSKRFYDEIYKVYPDYDKWDKWLKKHGREYLLRML